VTLVGDAALCASPKVELRSMESTAHNPACPGAGRVRAARTKLFGGSYRRLPSRAGTPPGLQRLNRRPGHEADEFAA